MCCQYVHACATVRAYLRLSAKYGYVNNEQTVYDAKQNAPLCYDGSCALKMIIMRDGKKSVHGDCRRFR